MGDIIKGIIALVLIIVIGGAIFGGCQRNHGDGIKTCKNCGKGSVYSLGYCKTCYNGFYSYSKEKGYYN